MDTRQLGKTLIRFWAWIGLLICYLIVKALPAAWLYSAALAIANIGFLTLARHRRTALNSLAIAFGREKSPQEIKKIAKESFVFIARSGTELIFLMYRPQLLREHVFIENKRLLDSALSRGKGVILVSGHFGNFPLMMLRLKNEGYPISGIMRRMRDVRVDKMLSNMRKRLGIKTIHSQPRKACVEATLKALKKEEVVCIQLDQNFGKGGVFVDFFGQKAATATGPVVLALRTKAALLPCFIVREKEGRHKIIFEQEFNLEQKDNFQETVQVNTQALTAIIESYIRRYPSHWSWVHRRWKTKPS